MTKKEIASAFSNGRFDETFPYLSEDAVWTVVEENTFTGKQAIVDNCLQVGAYFKSVTTHFKTLHVIGEGNKVVVSGSAEFTRNHERVAFVSACDVYEFNDADLIERITSYCIQAK